MVNVDELKAIEAEFSAKHLEYRQIISQIPLAPDDSHDPETTLNIIAEGTFIRYFTLWEKSVEKAFLYFCCGGQTLNGLQPVRRLAECDSQTAKMILSSGKRYLDWSNQGIIRERAKLFFVDGIPFYDPIIGKSHVLSDAEKIRNVIAHDSLESWNSYRIVQRNNYRTERSFVMSPGQMLRTRVRRTRENWGEFYFDEIFQIFTAVLRQ